MTHPQPYPPKPAAEHIANQQLPVPPTPHVAFPPGWTDEEREAYTHRWREIRTQLPKDFDPFA